MVDTLETTLYGKEYVEVSFFLQKITVPGIVGRRIDDWPLLEPILT